MIPMSSSSFVTNHETRSVSFMCHIIPDCQNLIFLRTKLKSCSQMFIPNGKFLMLLLVKFDRLKIYKVMEWVRAILASPTCLSLSIITHQSLQLNENHSIYSSKDSNEHHSIYSSKDSKQTTSYSTARIGLVQSEPLSLKDTMAYKELLWATSFLYIDIEEPPLMGKNPWRLENPS